MPSSDSSARVALVGAGPGDPGLLTRRGEQLMRRADVILYDGLSNPALLNLAPAAEHICVGKHGLERIWSQEEINAEMLRHAQLGRRVVRLKGGDPAVFARTTEEIEALRNAGIRFEVVPGITAALAAGSFAGIPITHRGLASAVALVTGHEEPSKAESALDWEALARFPGTLVIYMGVTTVDAWTTALLSYGKPADTPVAILRRCSLSDQQTVLCRLDEVAERLTPASKMRPPVIVIIGEVARLAELGSWFSDRPLFGQRVLVTRAEDQADELCELLNDVGAETLAQPAIVISACGAETSEASSLKQAIDQLSQYDLIVFSSQNGVHYFMEALLDHGCDARSLAHVKIVAVGVKTAAYLRRYGLTADIVPAEHNATGIVTHLGKSVAGQRVLLPRASRGPDTLPQGLRAAGADVSEVVTYLHQDVAQPAPSILKLMEAGAIQWTTVTSSGIARSLVRMFGSSLKHTQLVSLSPLTSATLVELGFAPAAEASEPTMLALRDAILQRENQTHHL